MIFDAHVHFWNYNPQRDVWIDKNMGAITRDFLPEDYLEAIKNHEVNGCIAVQADQSEEETEFLLKLAEKHKFIKGVVGWVDLTAEDVAEKLKKFSQNKNLKGIRYVLQDKENDFCLNQTFLNGISKLQNFDLTYDILVDHRQLNSVIHLVEDFPEQPFVLDHLGKPDIKNIKYQDWKKNIERLAEFRNVQCKLSGMVTEADWQSWKPENFKPYLDTVFTYFGTERVFFGSDWPVCKLAGDYQAVVKLMQDYTSLFSKSEKEAIFYKNAQKFYKI
ncbi:amidohydrolase family protein [Autumnicola musiva]|uniref:Amidohydrolase family protein n=1 Tax=Autumnicola musiva TaxID=3075589 RepID=A0ABU3D160_9FLAO|nr:amidohydrolase family protein [Zunongwangia sp. F117]MDT0675270.1 amidohydrolase family protein [Zunongwangia sp. F117]